MFNGSNLVAGYIDVARLWAGIEVETGHSTHRFTAFVPNGKAILQNGEVGGKRRQGQKHENARNEFSLQLQFNMVSTTAATPHWSFDSVTCHPFCFSSGHAFSMITACPANSSISTSL